MPSTAHTQLAHLSLGHTLITPYMTAEPWYVGYSQVTATMVPQLPVNNAKEELRTLEHLLMT